MSPEKNEPAENNWLNELDDPLIRRAVEQIRGNPAPENAMRRALDRAEKFSTVVATVRRHPSRLRPKGWTMWMAVSSICVLFIWGAVIPSVREARKQARRTPMRQNLKQIGLALHVDESGKILSTSSATGKVDADAFPEDDAIFPVGTTTRTRGEDVNGLLETGVEHAQAAGGQSVKSKNLNVPKKVIHTANVSLVVEELSKLEKQMNDLLERIGGHVDNSQVLEPQGQQRSAQWVVRVPVETLQSFLQEVTNLGNPENRATNRRDVTAEYVDLETRIASKKQLEKRILGLLEKHTGDIKDVIAVEEQLARIRNDIESMQGRVKYLDAVTVMATVTISAREQKNYVPPQAPSFSSEISRTWTGTLDMMQRFGKTTLLVAVAVAPWLALIGLTGFLCIRVRRRQLARKEA